MDAIFIYSTLWDIVFNVFTYIILKFVIVIRKLYLFQKSSQHNRADLEAELTRLQSVLDELANHRQEINNSVEKLKNEAGGSKGSEVRASPTGVAGNFF